jgi:O-antigen ligase
MKAVISERKVALVSSWIIALILFTLPFHALFTTWLGSNFDHWDLWRIWKDILVVLLLLPVSWIVTTSRQTRQWLVNSWIVRLFLVYLLLHIVLAIWALSRDQVSRLALIYSLIINLRFITFFIICAVVAANSNFLTKHWRKILFLPSYLVIIFGLAQKFVLPLDFLKHFGYSPHTIPAYQTVDASLDYRRVQSTLRGANPLGAYLVLIIPGIVMTLKKGRQIPRLGLLAAFLVLFYSYSRSSWVGVAIALGLLIWIGISRYQLRWVFLSLLATVIVVGSPYLFSSNAPNAQDTFLHTSNVSKSPQSSNAVRSTAIKKAAKDVWHQPLGRGPGTAGPASFRNEGHSARVAENYYLQIGQETGIIGMAIFIAINILVGIELWHRQDPLARTLVVSLAGLMFVNLLLHAWTDDTIAYLWWGLAGIALAPAILDSRHKQNAKTQQNPA